MIFTAINFVAVILFVPETRYHRDEIVSIQVSTPGSSSIEKTEETVHVGEKTERAESNETRQVLKKSWIAELSLWSGVSDTNLFKMFIRYVNDRTSVAAD